MCPDEFCLSQKDVYEVGDLVALKIAPKVGTGRHINGVVVRLVPNHHRPDTSDEQYAIVKLIGDPSINGVERTFSYKDMFFLNKEPCSIVK
jgi:hypothetical protein